MVPNTYHISQWGNNFFLVSPLNHIDQNCDKYWGFPKLLVIEIISTGHRILCLLSHQEPLKFPSPSKALCLLCLSVCLFVCEHL
jgi:hypothetical protein